MSFKSLSMTFILTVVLFFSYSHFSKVFAAPDLTNLWSSANMSFPFPVASQTSFVIGNKLFLMGGANTNDYSSVYSSVMQDGELSLWHEQENKLPQSRFWSASVSNSRIYIIGGASTSLSSYYTATTISGITGQDGEVASWRNEASLPQPLGLGAAAIVGDRIYFSGGFNNNYVSDTVYSAVINTDGSLGDWEDVSTLPFRVYGHGMVAYGEYLYVIGGIGNSTILTGKVNPDGTITSWETKAAFPQPVYRAGVTLVNNYIYVVGGNDGNDELDTVYYTTINSDGTLEPWGISNNPLPNKIQGGTLTQVNDYLYYIGGYHISYLDTVYKTKLDITPTPSATPTPTIITPTPIPPETNLNVPLYMQTNNLWESQIYDSANEWAPNTPGINSWGCAITSAVMIFRYQGITKLPDGKDLNPGTLNTWLKSQNDGYVNTGWVNWLALSRLSKLAKSKNPLFSFDALEYSRSSGYNPSQLSQDLGNNIPGILEVPGHFIVGRGISGDTFKINDPYYDRDSLISYSNTFLSLGRFVPSHTDLSYLMFAVDDGVVITVKDKDGVEIGEGFTQQPIDEDGGSKTNGPQFYMYYVKKPTDGSYTVEVKSLTQRSYSLQAYLYDQNGAVKKYTQPGVVGPQKSDMFEIIYDQKKLKKASMREKTTFDKLISDIEYFYEMKMIKNKTIYLLMRETAIQARNAKSKKIAKAFLSSFTIILDTNKKKVVSIDAYDILKLEAGSLMATL